MQASVEEYFWQAWHRLARSVLIYTDSIIEPECFLIYLFNCRKVAGLQYEKKGVILAIANLPDLTKAPRYVESPNPDVTIARVTAFNAAIARQTNASGALLVDLFSKPLDDSVTTDIDGFHPNDTGHQVIADAFLAVILPEIFGTM